MPPDASDVSVRHVRASVSLLSPDGSAHPGEGRPACFDDLNLDQIVAAVTAGREPYELRGIFNAPLCDSAGVTYRQAVFRDFETAELKAAFENFAAAMLRSRQAQVHAGEQRHTPERQRWVLTAVLDYCRGVAALVTELKRLGPSSEALKALTAFGAEYVGLEAFALMRERTEAVAAQLSALRYTVQIQGLNAGTDPAMVSMVSQVDPDDPARRTFKVERRAADGLAYARAIARKHGLTREQIDRRLETA